MSEPIISRRKLRKIAKEVLRIGQKIFFHKKDLVTAEEMEKWEKSMVELNATLRDKKSSDEELRAQIEVVDEHVSRHGELFYHKKSWVENIEMFLVAAIVVIGIRSFFLQPFIIPTNSMFPSYYGMKPRIYEDGTELPGLPQRTANKLLLGADHYRINAKARGQLYVKGHAEIGRHGQPAFRADYTVKRAYFPNGKFFVFPSNVREYVFNIGGHDHELRVSAEFDLDSVIKEKIKHHKEVWQDALPSGLYKLSEKIYEKDEIALAFDVLLGDALFVDRFTYNFRKPEVGDPIVFQTGGIDKFNEKILKEGLVPNKLSWSPIGEDKYYIKRLVGKAGNRLEIQTTETLRQHGISRNGDGLAGYLLRDGKPIEGCRAFRENRNAVNYLEQNPNNHRAPSGYPGYRATGLLRAGTHLKVPPKSFFAMGDNSPDSSDGRVWGFVPENKVVGRALLVYYPFTKRWGFPSD